MSSAELSWASKQIAEPAGVPGKNIRVRRRRSSSQREYNWAMQTTHATRQRQLPFFLRFLRKYTSFFFFFLYLLLFSANRDSRHGKCFQFSKEHDSVECMAIKMRLVACGSRSSRGKTRGSGGWRGEAGQKCCSGSSSGRRRQCHNNRGNNADNTMTTTAIAKKNDNCQQF